MRLCATQACSGGALASVEAEVTNYRVTSARLETPVSVTIGQKYYLSWDTPAPVGEEPWVAFWDGTSATIEGASAFQAFVKGYDEGSTRFQPTYFREQVDASQPTPTYGDYEHGLGSGASIRVGEEVEVSCRVFAPALELAEPEGFWYRIHSIGWNDNYYAPANSFRNGAKAGETIPIDRRVPYC
jgi:hypothetical protein